MIRTVHISFWRPLRPRRFSFLLRNIPKVSLQTTFTKPCCQHTSCSRLRCRWCKRWWWSCSSEMAVYSDTKKTTLKGLKTRFLTGTHENAAVAASLTSGVFVSKCGVIVEYEGKVVPDAAAAAALDVSGRTTEPFHAISYLSKPPSTSRHGRLLTNFCGRAGGHGQKRLYPASWRHADGPITPRYWTDGVHGGASLVNPPVRQINVLTSAPCTRTNTHPQQCHEMSSQVSLRKHIYGLFSGQHTLYWAAP